MLPLTKVLLEKMHCANVVAKSRYWQQFPGSLSNQQPLSWVLHMKPGLVLHVALSPLCTIWVNIGCCLETILVKKIKCKKANTDYTTWVNTFVQYDCRV